MATDYTGLQVRIYTEPVRDGISITLFYRMQQGAVMVAKPVEIQFQEIKEYQSVDPTLTLPGSMAREFMASMREALDKQGIVSDHDAKIAGTLDATREHLSDMRKLAMTLALKK